MRNGGTLDYKCRRCGKVFSPTHAPDTTTVVSCFVVGVPLPEGWGGVSRRQKVEATNMHECRKGVMGIGDFIGTTNDGARP